MIATTRIGMWAGLCFMIVVALSCKKELPLPDISTQKKIVLIGEFIAGDTFKLRAGQSIAVSGKEQLSFQLLEGLSLELKDTTGYSYPLSAYQDSFIQMLYTVPFAGKEMVKSGMEYTINANHASLGTATAHIKIPGPIDAAVTDTAFTMYSNNGTLRIRITINDPGNAVNYYVIEAVKQVMDIQGYFYYNGIWHSLQTESSLYDFLRSSGNNPATKFDTVFQNKYVRQPVYTSDINSDNVTDNGANTAAKRILLKDLNFNGSTYNTNVYVGEDNSGIPFDSTMGRVFVYIKSVSPDYFKFLKSYETYDPMSGYTSLEQPVKIEGNVINGLGMIGGVSQVTYTYISGRR